MNQKKPRIPYDALKIVEEALKEIRELSPSCEKIVEYTQGGGYGTVTYTNSDKLLRASAARYLGRQVWRECAYRSRLRRISFDAG